MIGLRPCFCMRDSRLKKIARIALMGGSTSSVLSLWAMGQANTSHTKPGGSPAGVHKARQLRTIKRWEAQTMNKMLEFERLQAARGNRPVLPSDKRSYPKAMNEVSIGVLQELRKVPAATTYYIADQLGFSTAKASNCLNALAAQNFARKVGLSGKIDSPYAEGKAPKSKVWVYEATER